MAVAWNERTVDALRKEPLKKNKQSILPRKRLVRRRIHRHIQCHYIDSCNTKFNTCMNNYNTTKVYLVITNRHILFIKHISANARFIKCMCLTNMMNIDAFIKPRRACASRGNYSSLVVCLSVCLFVTMLAATLFVYNG